MALFGRSTSTLLARRNLRRGRTQLLVVAVLAALAGGLLNLGALCGLRYPALLERETQRLNTPQVVVLGPPDYASQADRFLAADPRVHQREWTDVLAEYASFPLGKARFDNSLVYLDLDRRVDLGRTAIVTGATDPRAASGAPAAYLPYLFEANGSYRVGDTFTARSATGITRTFRVAGFVENIVLGQLTMGASAVALPHAEFEALAASPQSPHRAALVQATLRPGEDPTAVAADLASRLDDGSLSNVTRQVWTSTLIRSTALIGPMLYAASLVLFTLVVIIVVLMVLAYWIRTTIEQDLPTYGVLATFGTPIRSLAVGLALPATLVVLAGSACGVALSYVAVPTVARSLGGQTGLAWRPGIDLPAGLAGALFPAAAASALALLARRRLRRLQPVEALRGGTRATTFRRAWLPLATTRGGLQVLLGLKQGLAARAQALMVTIVCFVLALGSVFSASLLTNALLDKPGFVRMLIGDIGDISVAVAPGADRADLLRRIEAVPGVRTAVFRDYLEGTAAGVQCVVISMADFGQQTYSSIATGREPKHANEVAIGALLATQARVGLGDEIELRVGQRTARYVVVGTVSTIQYAGMRVDITTAGYQRVSPSFDRSGIDIYVDPGTDATTVLPKVRAAGGRDLTLIVNQQQGIDSQLGVYLKMMQILAWGILAITAAVTALVVGLVVASLLARDRVSFGVRRAMGFGGAQLMRQLLVAYLPPVAIGTIAGCAVGATLAPRVLAGFLAGVGLARDRVPTSSGMIVVIGAGIVTLAAAMIAAGSGPLLRRPPVALLTRD